MIERKVHVLYINQILFTNISFGSSQQDPVWKFEMLYFFPNLSYIAVYQISYYKITSIVT